MAAKKRKKTGQGMAQRIKSQAVEDIQRQQEEIQKRVREEQLKGVVTAAPHGRKRDHHEAVWDKIGQDLAEDEEQAALQTAEASGTKTAKSRTRKRKAPTRDRSGRHQLNVEVPAELVQLLRHLSELREETRTRPFSIKEMAETALLEWAQKAAKKAGQKGLRGMSATEMQARIKDLQR